jgi:hypothetical protein
MMAQRSKRQDYISNLSADLIAQALELIQEKSFPVYRKNIHQRNPTICTRRICVCGLLLLSCCGWS